VAVLVEVQPEAAITTVAVAVAVADSAIWSCLPQSHPAMPIRLGQVGRVGLVMEEVADRRPLPGRSRLEEAAAD